MNKFTDLLLLSLLVAAFTQLESGKENAIKLINNQEQSRVEISVNGALFTAYHYAERFKKPVLYPIKTDNGNPVTRGYPIEPRPGERIDHPHHVGLWFNYGDVNGLDFWNNSNAIPADEKDKYGTIVHKKINRIESGEKQGLLEVTMHWISPDGDVLLKENTTFVFRAADNKRMIDRTTRLQALDHKVSLKDNKEGLLGIRVARELEHPSNEPVRLTDSSGHPLPQPVVSNAGVTGNYLSSKGVEGTNVWGTRARWMILSGQIQDEKVSLIILDHPENIGFPTYWHARGYGLFAANPLGQEALSSGKEVLDFKLSAGDSVTFNHRIIIYSDEKATNKELEKEWRKFANNTAG